MSIYSYCSRINDVGVCLWGDWVFFSSIESFVFKHLSQFVMSVKLVHL